MPHDHSCAHPSCRHGGRLEDGAAHTVDHAVWSRRDFLSHLGLATVGTSVILGTRPRGLYGHTLGFDPLGLVETDRILVVIQLDGGNDGLNTIVPYQNDNYYRSRPTLGVTKNEAIAVNDQFGFHPAMERLKAVWDNGRMAVIHNTGYEDTDRSHFSGTVNVVSGVADTSQAGATGWLGRFHQSHFGIDNERPDPLSVRISGRDQIFRTPLGFEGNSDYGTGEPIRTVLPAFFQYQTEGLKNVPYARAQRRVRDVINKAFKYAPRIIQATDAGANRVDTYTTSPFNSDMATAAKMIRGGLDVRFIAVRLNGFDTHGDQGKLDGTHPTLLDDLANGVRSFLDDMAADGLDKRVLLMTYSEFGRTLIQNGNAGTDHGAGSCMFVFGPGVSGGFYGTPSDLVTQLTGGDPAPSTDYRKVYSSVLQYWFGGAPAVINDVLGAEYGTIDFISDKAEGSGGGGGGPFLIGDVTGNGDISAQDASEVLQHVASIKTLTGSKLLAADTSADGSVSAFDASLILQKVAGLITCFPGEAGCGTGKAAVAVEGSIGWGAAREGASEGERLVPLTVSSRDGGVVSLSVNAALDKTAFVLEEVQSNLPSDWIVVHQQSDQEVHIALAGSRPLTTETPLTLRIRVLNDTAPMTLEGSGILNEGATQTLNSETPGRFQLNQNYPNPFNPSTRIRYTLAEAAPVTLEVYDVQGRLVQTLVDREQPAGSHTVTFNAGSLSSGVYVYRLKTPGGAQSRRMTIVK